MSGIYVHIPFCNTKCVYCDFYSITDHSRKSELINCIVKEISLRSSGLEGTEFDSVYIGGGTPSLLSFGELSSVFEALYSNFRISPLSEVTIEANPGTLGPEKLKEFRRLPVNRISFGVQSFVDEELKFLTRIHSAEQAVKAITDAQDSGFGNINIDLIFALPDQSLEKWANNLETAVSLETQHISAYSLIFEEGTPLMRMLNKGNVALADEEHEAAMFELTMDYLPVNGLRQYEVSNYAKEGYECRHNLKYWTYQEYLGFGPSAASFINNRRTVNVRNLNEYIGCIESSEEAFELSEQIDREKSVTEYIFLGLRSQGINFPDFRRRYGFEFRMKFSDSIAALVNNGLATQTSDTLSLTKRGYALCDEIAAACF